MMFAKMLVVVDDDVNARYQQAVVVVMYPCVVQPANSVIALVTDARILAIMCFPQDTRRMVAELAKQDFTKAMTLAHTINDPWFRCQSLACAARSIQDRKMQKSALDDAFKAALATDDPNRIVTVSAWPLGILAELKYFDRFDCELDRLLRLIATEPHPIRRCDAVFELLLRGQQAHKRSIIKMTNALIAHCLAGHGWKRDRNLRDAAMILKHVGLQDHAKRCIEIIEKPRVRRQAQRMMDE